MKVYIVCSTYTGPDCDCGGYYVERAFLSEDRANKYASEHYAMIVISLEIDKKELEEAYSEGYL